MVYRNNAPVRFSDLATVSDGTEDVRNTGLARGKPAIMLFINRQPNANMSQRFTDEGPAASVPCRPSAGRRSRNRERPHEHDHCIRKPRRTEHDDSIGLVIVVVFLFLLNGWATFIPSVSVPISLIATLGRCI